jgi:hypothetical protein
MASELVAFVSPALARYEDILVPRRFSNCHLYPLYPPSFPFPSLSCTDPVLSQAPGTLHRPLPALVRTDRYGEKYPSATRQLGSIFSLYLTVRLPMAITLIEYLAFQIIGDTLTGLIDAGLPVPPSSPATHPSPPSSPPRAHHRVTTVTSHIGGPHHQCVVPLPTSSWGRLGKGNGLASSQIALRHRTVEDMPRAPLKDGTYCTATRPMEKTLPARQVPAQERCRMH